MAQNIAQKAPFASLFLSIQKHIANSCPDIRYIEQDLGQLEQEIPQVTYPCALIDFIDWQFEDIGENAQIGTGIVSIRIAFEAHSNTSNIANKYAKDYALKYYDIEWNVYKALQGWRPERFNALVRTAVSTEPREDNMRVRQILFSTAFEDDSASVGTKKIQANACITTKLSVGTFS